MKNTRIINRKKFFLNIILPSLLTQALFIALIFAVIIPYFNHNLIEAKKEMVKELINSALCIADEYYSKAEKGEISIDEAKEITISTIKSIRYGIENKDYIWIINHTPIMIMHPYRKDLNGKNVENFTDPEGKKMFLEMVKVVESNGEGYVNYMWQWMDDSTRIVPKISYVKKSDKWNWIIGTGVYIEDIRDSIANVVSTLIWTSLGIFSIISFLLIIIIQRNLRVEHQRKIAEDNLKHSNEKYKALVEASKDGTLMFIGDNCVYKNKIITDMISQDLLDNLSKNLIELLTDKSLEDLTIIDNFLESDDDTLQIETQIKSNDNDAIYALINFSKVSFAGNNGLIVLIKDLSLEPDEPGANLLFGDIINNISSKLNIGIFRALAGRKGSITEANREFLNILGYNSINELSNVDLFSLFEDNLELRRFITIINSKRIIRDYDCNIYKNDGSTVHIIVSAIITKQSDTGTDIIEGIITKYSNYKFLERNKEKLLNELINNNNIWDLPLSSANHYDIPIVSANITIKTALELMDFYSSEILQFELLNTNYFITKYDIIDYLKISNINFDISISNLRPRNSLVLDKNTPIIVCFLEMMKNKSNFAVINIDGKFKYLDIFYFINNLNSNVKHLTSSLNNSRSIREIKQIHHQLPAYISSMVDSGTDNSLITKTITAVSGVISTEIIKKVINQIGTPPCDFAFIALGSEGRSEQGLSTDQDNAIIYLDDSNSEFTINYFALIAQHVNRLLNEVGYKLCVGEIMANNPKWNQPLSIWKKYFKKWIEVPEPQQIIDTSIFFDFRNIFGKQYLADELRSYANSILKSNPSFLTHVATTIINYKLPVNIFGKIQTNAKDETSDYFNLKNAIRLIVNIVRLYAMKHLIDETNTLQRLEHLYNNKNISKSFYSEVKYCYNYLMHIQLKNQVYSYKKGLEPGNYLDLTDLTPTELSNLKNVLNNVSTFQAKVKYDFGLNQ